MRFSLPSTRDLQGFLPTYMAKASIKRKLLRTGIVLVCLFIPLLLWRLWLVFAVDSQLKVLRTAGLPTNGDELNKWYAAVPDAENAALILKNAFDLRRNYSDSRSNLVRNFKLPPRGVKLSSDQTELLAGYIELNAAALAKAEEALRLPGSRYPIDCSMGSQTPLPHLAQLKNLAEINQYKAELAATNGDTREVARAIASILGLARTLDKEPTLISELVRLRIVSAAVATLERGLNHGLNFGQMTNLPGLLAPAAHVNGLTNALIGERAMIAPYFRISRYENPSMYAPLKDGEGDTKDILQRGDWGMLKLIGYYEMDLGQFLFTMRNVIELASADSPDYLEIDKHFVRAAAASRKKRRNLSASLFLNYVYAGAREGDILARLRLAITALALENFRTKNGRLPDKLGDLKPEFLAEIPDDPFAGTELLYRRLPKGYVIYSIGRDLMDDGGKEPPENPRGNDRCDVTFTVER
jgi:hypothetical protein